MSVCRLENGDGFFSGFLGLPYTGGNSENISINYSGSFPTGNTDPNNPGDSSKTTQGYPIRAVEGTGFRVLYDEIDVSGEDYIYKPVRIETPSWDMTFSYHTQADSSEGIAKGDFKAASDPELFEVMLASVGAATVDDLSDIFVTRPFTREESISPEEVEQAVKIVDLWTRIGYISLVPNGGIEDLTDEQRQQLLNFEENLLKATALTDEFQGYGLDEDAVLLSEMVQLGRVYAALDPQSETAIPDVESPPEGSDEVPDALFLTRSAFHEEPTNTLIQNRLETDLGFEVETIYTNTGEDLDSDVFEGVDLVVTGNVRDLEFLRDVDIPIVFLDPSKTLPLDLWAFTEGVNKNNIEYIAAEDIVIEADGHPLAAGLSGVVDIFTEGQDSFYFIEPAEDAIRVGGTPSQSNSSLPAGSSIFAYEEGDALYNGKTAAARMVSFLAYWTIDDLTDEGWQLFDAAVEWAADTVEEPTSGPEELTSALVEDIEDSFLQEIWEIKKGTKEQDADDEAKMQEGIEKINELLKIFEDPADDLELLNYQKKLLVAAGRMSEAEGKAINPDFLDQILEIGSIYFQVSQESDSDIETSVNGINFLSELKDAEDESDINSLWDRILDFGDQIKESVENFFNNGEASDDIDLAQTTQLLYEHRDEFVEKLGEVIEPLRVTMRSIGQFIIGAAYQFTVDQGEPMVELLSLDPELDAWFEGAEEAAEENLLPDTTAFEAGRLFGDGAAVVTGLVELVTGASLIAGGLGIGGLGAAVCIPTLGGGCLAGGTVSAIAIAGGGVLVAQGAMSAEAGIENIAEAIFAMAASGGSGGIQYGDPVNGLGGFTYRKSKNNSKKPEDIEYEIEATGKGQQNRDFAVHNPNDPVEFDWFDLQTKRVIDAKNWRKGGRQDITKVDKNGNPDSFIEKFVKPDILKTAQRQAKSIEGTAATGVEWRIRDREIANAVQDFFDDNNILIDVIHYPYP